MGIVYTEMSVSLDGYIAGPDESGFDRLFRWYGNGDVVWETASPDLTFRMTEASARVLREALANTGAFVVGRRLFDLTNGWNGRHPFDVPVVVLTHETPKDWPYLDTAPFTFVTEGGVEAAVATAKEVANGGDVGVNGGTVATQCLDVGLLDEVGMALVPVMLGGGVPYFGPLENGPLDLEGPVRTVQGKDVTHLRYRVRRA